MTSNATLCLHRGSNLVDYGAVQAAICPPSTPTYCPIPHDLLVDTTLTTIKEFGLDITNVRHALSADQTSYFGVLDVVSRHPDFCVAVGIRNDSAKRFPAALAIGTRVFCCDNLAFSSQLVVARRHTKHIRRDLAGLISQAFGKLGDSIYAEADRLARYQLTALRERDARFLMIEGLRQRAWGPTAIPKIFQHWHEPAYAEFRDKTVYRFHNAVTEYGKTLAADKLVRCTRKLKGLCDLALTFAA